MKTKLSVIYDMTKQCPWNCAICCMGASPDKAQCGNELTLEQKKSLIDDLVALNEIRDVRIDFSGGEIFTNLDNISVIEYAAEKLGKDKIGISSSGYRINDAMAERLSHCISDCEMTMDSLPGTDYRLRPKYYADTAAQAVSHLKKHGIGTGIQTVLAKSNCTEENLRGIYCWLCENGVDEWSLLRFYPSGRGRNYRSEVISAALEKWVVDFITELDRCNISANKPAIDFHYTMKGHKKYSSVCRCVKKSIGIMPNGNVTACFWAVDSQTDIIDPKFHLGNVATESLTEILTNEKSQWWMSCSHCCELQTLEKSAS